MEILPSVEKALGDYYRAHQDVGTQGFASRRLLTFVHYLHRTPRPFEGGALRVYDGATSMHDGGRPLTREDRAWQDWGPDHDSIVFFLPDKWHEVRTVTCPGKDPTDSRFAVNGGSAPRPTEHGIAASPASSIGARRRLCALPSSAPTMVAGRLGTRQDVPVPKNPPESVQQQLRRRLNRHARACRPLVDAVTVNFRAGFAYVAAELPGHESLPLCRLRFTGEPHVWGFALYRADNDGYRDTLPAGSPEEALDCAGHLHPGVLLPVVQVPTGLVVLVGPPASGRTSFVRALVERRQIAAEAVVASDEIRAELFGTSPAHATSDAADAEIFKERDRRIDARLASGRTAVAESTNVTPQARARLVDIARRFDVPVTMLRFDPDVTGRRQSTSPTQAAARFSFA